MTICSAKPLDAQFIDAVGAGVAVLDLDGRIVRLNRTAEEMSGYSESEVIGKVVWEILVPEEDAELDHATFLDVISHGGESGGVSRLVARSGWEKLVSWQAVLFPDENKPTHCVVTVADVTPHAESEQVLKLHSAALGATSDMVVITDANGIIQYVNGAFTRGTGYSLDEVTGQTPRILNSGQQDVEFYQQFWETISAGRVWTGELVNRRKDGSLYTDEMTVTPMRDEAGEIAYFVATKRDVSEQKALEGELAELARTDPLTGLLNRNQFNMLLAHVVEQTGEGAGALVTLDLDELKFVNDAYGSGVGDELIAKIAEDLKSALSPSEEIGRVGGDEFAFVLHDVTDEEASQVAAGMVERVSEISVSAGEESARVQCSAGVATFSNGGVGAEDLLAQADIALLHAKREGPRVVVYGDLDGGREAISGLQRARAMIVKALDSDKIQLDWQPIVATDSRALHMFEVLARLEDSSGKLRFPSDFVSQAETLRLIDRVDRHVVRSALQMVTTLAENGAMPRLSVNLSTQSINDDMCDFLLAEAAGTEYPLDRLTIEVTETSVLQAGDEVREVMWSLASAGVDFAMDDFGSGATSIRNLESLPFSYMKLDGSYVRGLAESSRSRDFVGVLAKLAETLGLSVIAEHVEDEATLKFLRSTGIEYVQGYFTGQPVPMPWPVVAGRP